MGHLFLQPEQVHLCTGVSTSAADKSWGPGVFVGQLDSEQTLQVHMHSSKHKGMQKQSERSLHLKKIRLEINLALH